MLSEVNIKICVPEEIVESLDGCTFDTLEELQACITELKNEKGIT